jgi:inner membrane protein
LDSITQIVLGAGVGELILGRKLGNRAMVWGAVAGTIPDLDVISNVWQSQAETLRSHRGLTHSIFLLTLFSFVMAWITNKVYANGDDLRKNALYKTLGLLGRSILFLGIMALISGLIMFFSQSTFIKFSLIGTILALSVIYMIRMFKRYNHADNTFDTVSYWQWFWFFFWTLITHPILDCFTVYGTQLLSPFTDMRVSWDNIAVADPMYTALFGVPLWIASFFHRSTKTRFILAILGLSLSSLYMTWTFYNKTKVTDVLVKTIKDQNIPAIRHMNNPTILNNLLWAATVETQDTFYTGLYSLLDKEKKFTMTAIPKNLHLIKDIPQDDYTVNTIKWFSKNYHAAIIRKDGRLQINDLRYGTFRGRGHGEDDFIFKFIIERDANEKYQINPASQDPSADMDMRKMMGELIQRIKGI